MDTHELFLAVVSKDSSFMHALALLPFTPFAVLSAVVFSRSKWIWLVRGKGGHG
jgi:hypothetical protein